VSSRPDLLCLRLLIIPLSLDGEPRFCAAEHFPVVPTRPLPQRRDSPTTAPSVAVERISAIATPLFTCGVAQAAWE
jgi:hypothetical protein